MPWLASIFGIFLVRQFCLAIPTEMIEAARVDGASEWIIFRRIVLPTLKPVLVTLALFVFLGSWNDFMWPLIVLADQNPTLPVALAALSREHVQDNELMMAGSVVTVLPVLVLFLVLQRHYLDGLLAGSVKGVKRLAALPALSFAVRGYRRQLRSWSIRWTMRRRGKRKVGYSVAASSAANGGAIGLCAMISGDVSGYGHMRRPVAISVRITSSASVSKG